MMDAIKNIEVKESESRLERVTDDIIAQLYEYLDNTKCPCYLELRPGTGGEDAMKFCSILMTMYCSYMTNRNFPYKIVHIQEDGSKRVRVSFCCM